MVQKTEISMVSWKISILAVRAPFELDKQDDRSCYTLTGTIQGTAMTSAIERYSRLIYHNSAQKQET